MRSYELITTKNTHRYLLPLTGRRVDHIANVSLFVDDCLSKMQQPVSVSAEQTGLDYCNAVSWSRADEVHHCNVSCSKPECLVPRDHVTSRYTLRAIDYRYKGYKQHPLRATTNPLARPEI